MAEKEEKKTITPKPPAAKVDVKAEVKAAILELLEGNGIVVEAHIPKSQWDLRDRKLTIPSRSTGGLVINISLGGDEKLNRTP